MAASSSTLFHRKTPRKSVDDGGWKGMVKYGDNFSILAGLRSASSDILEMSMLLQSRDRDVACLAWDVEQASDLRLKMRPDLPARIS